MNLMARTHTAEDFGAVQEYFHSRNWTDGLPIVPPTPETL